MGLRAFGNHPISSRVLHQGSPMDRSSGGGGKKSKKNPFLCNSHHNSFLKDTNCITVLPRKERHADISEGDHFMKMALWCYTGMPV